jgi:hypothetical protein
MANGVPVRLSEALTLRARTVAAVQDRSLTEQVEHWARLGQVVEAAISAETMQRLKARSYDEGLEDALGVADTAQGRAAAAMLIRAENPVRYEELSRGTMVAVTREGYRSGVASPHANGTAKSSMRAVAGARAGMKLRKKSLKSR